MKSLSDESDLDAEVFETLVVIARVGTGWCRGVVELVIVLDNHV